MTTEEAIKVLKDIRGDAQERFKIAERLGQYMLGSIWNSRVEALDIAIAAVAAPTPAAAAIAAEESVK